MGEALRCRRRARKRPSISARLLLFLSHRRAAIFLLCFLFIFLPASFARLPQTMSAGYLRHLHTIKSRCFACIRDIWGSSLLLSLKRHARINGLQLDSPVVTPQNLLLLANVVVFITLVYLHLRSPAAARVLKRRTKRKGLEVEGSAELVDLSAMEDSSYFSEQHSMSWMPPLMFDSNDIHEREADECCATASSSAGATDSINDIHDLDVMMSTRDSDFGAVRLVGEAAAVPEPEDVNQRAFSTGSDGDVGDPAQQLLLQDGLSVTDERDSSDLADTQPRHSQQLHEAHTISCSCDPPCSRALSHHSFCSHHSKMKIHAPVSETTTSTWQSENQASHLHSITVSKSARLQDNNHLTDPESADPSLASRPRVKSMDSTDKPSNGDGGQAACRRKKKHRDSSANAVKSRPLSLRREPSMTSQEELNARVETFISKFNQKIKIQRQQSLLSFIQMVNRGT